MVAPLKLIVTQIKIAAPRISWQLPEALCYRSMFMAWYESTDVSLSAWLADVSELFSGVLSAVFSVPVLALFATVLLLLVVLGLLTALVRQRGLGR